MAGLHLHDSSRHVGWQLGLHCLDVSSRHVGWQLGLHCLDVSSRHVGWQGFTYMIALGMWGGS